MSDNDLPSPMSQYYDLSKAGALSKYAMCVTSPIGEDQNEGMESLMLMSAPNEPRARAIVGRCPKHLAKRCERELDLIINAARHLAGRRALGDPA